MTNKNRALLATYLLVPCILGWVLLTVFAVVGLEPFRGANAWGICIGFMVITFMSTYSIGYLMGRRDKEDLENLFIDKI